MPKRRDEGHEETEAVLRDIEKRISKEYSQAEKEIQSKLDDYMKRFKTKDRIKRQAVEDGKITDSDYRKWLTGQIAMGKRWEEMKDTIATDLTNASKIAKSITAEHMPDVYAINHNYGTFQVESDGKVDTSYTLYNRDTAERMFQDTDFYKKPGKKIQKAINEGKQMAWDKKQIQSVMFQGIVQGEYVGDIATRISKATCDSDRKAAIRNARTITTGIENAGRTDAYKRAEDMGVDVKQQWLATLDFRTRHEHRELDGQVVALGEKFEVEGEQIEYPGDPSAADFLVYNCRCTLVPVVGGFERDNSLRHDSHLGDMSYEEWKESKEVYSDPITKQDDIAQMMKESYIQDYRYLEGKNPYLPLETSENNDIINTEIQQSKADRYIEAASTEEEKEYIKKVFDGEYKYKESSTIEEAKEYLKSLGISTSDYDKVNLEYANMLNRTLTDYYNTFGNLNKGGYLDEIRIVPKLSSVAGYQTNYHAVLLQKKDTSSRNVLSKLEKEAQSEKTLGWWSTGDSGTVIRHELGHAIHHMYTDDVTGSAFGNTVVKSREISKIRNELMAELGIDKYNGSNEDLEIINKAGEKFSYYALRNDGEFVAEAVAEYMTGSPRETARRVVEILIGG